MRSLLKNIYDHFLFRCFLFWMILFSVFRLFFVMYNFHYFQGSFGHKLVIFVAGLRLDVATAGYLLIPVFLLWALYVFIQKQWFFRFLYSINICLIVTVVFIAFVNVINYVNWQSVVSKRILLYLNNPLEVSRFMTTAQIAVGLLSFVLMLVCFLWFHAKFVGRHKKAIKNLRWGLAYLASLPLLLIGIRGGVQGIPINESDSFYSRHISNDHAAVNPFYYFTHSVYEYYVLNSNNKFKFYTSAARNKHVKSLMEEGPVKTTALTHVKKPNLVIIVLESWTADIIAELGGEKNTTPFTSELIKDSYLFTHCYGSGARTDQGLVSILAGYPAQPDNSIMAYPEKTRKLPSLIAFLNSKKYQTSFFYGGDLNFAQTRSFVVQQGFEFISDKSHYQSKDYNSKWGAHDDKVLDAQIDHLNTLPEPFASCVLTLSTHEPFEVPGQKKFPGNDMPDRFKNAAYYTDACLRQYFSRAKKTSWYKNTLFLLVADHGHSLPRNRDLNWPEGKRILCMLTGGALNDTLVGKKWDSVLGQNDLLKMISPYYGYNPKKFKFAKDPFKAKHKFAYYATEYVMALITDSTAVL
ncbi:MAG TPA: sulfatase-like hydrolase/transferase [Flavobacteriales bacterium]|nr:sulfatase-like hydrolase/transferase [Flavobacteriales bacterium]